MGDRAIHRIRSIHEKERQHPEKLSRVLDRLKSRLGAARIADLNRIMSALCGTRFKDQHINRRHGDDAARRPLGTRNRIWRMTLGINPAHGLLKVHSERKPHAPWPDEIIKAIFGQRERTIAACAASVPLHRPRVGDVVALKWSDLVLTVELP